MAPLHSEPTNAITSVVLLLLVSLPPTILSQNPPLPTAPTVSDCTPRLLPLAPCAPFIQGMAQTPVQPCCDNLNQLYQEQPGCICLLLNDSTNFSSFPINRTLALELPALCNVLINIAACSGTPQIVSTPPASQASPGAPSNSSAGRHTNYSIAASPVVEGEPRSSIMGIGFHRSTGVKLEAQGSSMLLVTLGVISLSKAFRWV
ncbi:hypothetical protein OIU76_021839 [Salix suchowensis]|uniref:Bifunctional inhibitor/plant lipid transfer protein/seed storage helical domain-containing protein n=1 Tax=Salix suchowensis TaxID=1278906 RepID=A0ABQ9AJ07_9ROSI|nr:hypothetical protein OIU76_021839 [Salix suchowensis]KAJ6340147.1 hypothetical protein OIU77_007988 [Salix suchowensis]